MDVKKFKKKKKQKKSPINMIFAFFVMKRDDRQIIKKEKSQLKGMKSLRTGAFQNPKYKNK